MTELRNAFTVGHQSYSIRLKRKINKGGKTLKIVLLPRIYHTRIINLDLLLFPIGLIDDCSLYSCDRLFFLINVLSCTYYIMEYPGGSFPAA